LLWWSLILIWFAIHYTSTSPEYRYPNFRHCYVYIADKYLVGLEILYGAAGEYNWKSTDAGRGLSSESISTGQPSRRYLYLLSFFPHHLLADSVRVHFFFSFFFSFDYYYGITWTMGASPQPESQTGTVWWPMNEQRWWFARDTLTSQNNNWLYSLACFLYNMHVHMRYTSTASAV
jgi:hypothetical protein